jgi:hypothetical protein
MRKGFAFYIHFLSTCLLLKFAVMIGRSAAGCQSVSENVFVELIDMHYPV